jgi:type IV pilus assembly protein PilM
MVMKFLTPYAGKTTTLYISDTSIRLMVTRGKRISKLADIPLDTSLTDAGSKVKENELVNKIKHLFKTNRIKAKKVIIGLSGLHCLSRPAVLPQLPKAMLDEAVIREAKRVLPVPPDQLYISWQVVSTLEGKMQVFMVGIPRHIADTLLSVLNQVGVKPYLMDIKPLALARLVKEPTAILMDVQTREFDIVIINNGIPQPIRTVPFPQEVLSLPEKLAIVKDELKRTIEFYNSNNPEKRIQPDIPLCVSGDLAEETELYESLADELGYKVSPLASPLKCPKQLDPLHYLVNVGLTLKEIPKEAGPLLPNLNTLPSSYQPKPLSLTKLMALPVGTVAVGVIVALVMSIQGTAADIASMSDNLDNANFILGKKQSEKTALTDEKAQLENKLAQMQAERNKFINVSKSLDIRGEQINGDLEASVNNLVKDLSLGSISHSGGQLRLNGLALSEAEIFGYARNLDATERFSEITINNISRIEVGDNVTSNAMNFSLTLKLKE